MASDDHNFASFAWIFPGLKTWKILTFKGATLLTEISATSGSQKFLNLQNLKFFFSEKSIFQDFDDRFFQRRGCGGSEISFWSDPSWLRLKPHGRPKSRTGPPRGVTNISSYVMILILVYFMYLKILNIWDLSSFLVKQIYFSLQNHFISVLFSVFVFFFFF